MRFFLLAILLAFPVADLYVTARVARWTGIPLWVWLGCSFLAGLVLMRNERMAFRTRTVAALHGDQSLLRGVLDSGRKVLAALPADASRPRVGPDRADAARAAAQRRPRTSGRSPPPRGGGARSKARRTPSTATTAASTDRGQTVYRDG